MERDKLRRNIRLNELITELRYILNEMCTGTEDIEISRERLILSKCLDELIVEYMNNLESNK